MKNRKYKLLPYDIIEKAAAGEPEAVSTVIQHYIGYIKYLYMNELYHLFLLLSNHDNENSDSNSL